MDLKGVYFDKCGINYWHDDGCYDRACESSFN